MKLSVVWSAVVVSVAWCVVVRGVGVSEVPDAGAFAWVAGGESVPIVVDGDEPAVVGEVAVAALAEDVWRVTGVRPEVVVADRWDGGRAVLVGTVGESDLIDRLVAEGRIRVDDLEGQWESFRVEVVEGVGGDGARALVVVGSDRRGTAYGVFEVSRAMGVSPWVWWADAVVKKREELYVRAGGERVGPPSVKYRGVFLNDEGWGLQEWAEKTYEPEVGDIGPKTYAAIFELLLRLRANYLWPAMHPSTRAFNFYPENKLVADRYGIVMGSSHAEPMLRNNVDEWARDGEGDWNFFTNRENVLRYWEERVAENGRFENIYTVGMRGIHDSAMVGTHSMEERVRAMETIIAEQRAMIERHTGERASDVPQAFVPYKEVLPIYRAGLDVPEDVTLVWVEDNFGYVRNFSTPSERERSGGSGIYYHVSYWGMPHDYLWLNSTSIGLIWEEMTKGYEFGADRIWVLNVGDIKPCEIGMDYFLELAWDVDAYGPESARSYLAAFFAENIDEQRSEAMAELMNDFFVLCHVRKPEHMGWSTVYPTIPVQDTELSHWAHGDEAQRRLDAFADLESRADRIALELPREAQDAYFQLVLYPIRGTASMARKILYAEKSRYAAFYGLPVANEYAALAREAYEQIQTDTDYYNHTMLGGKWGHMMTYDPRGLAVYGPPSVAEVDVAGEPELVVFAEGRAVPAEARGARAAAGSVAERSVVRAEASEAEVSGRMVLMGTDGGSVLTLPQHAAEQVIQGEDGSARADFVLEGVVAGRYRLEIEARHPDAQSDSWYVRVGDGASVVVNDHQTGERFAWIRVAEVGLSEGVQRIRVVAREDGAQLRRLRLVPSDRPGPLQHRVLTREPNRLPSVNRYTGRRVFVDLYNRGGGEVVWEARASADWVELSATEGRFETHERLMVGVAYDRAPVGEDVEATVTLSAGDERVVLTLPVVNPARDLPAGTWVQENGSISIEAAAFDEEVIPAPDLVRWGDIGGVGYSGSVMSLFPRLVEAPMPLVPGETAPALTYRLYAFEGGEATITFRALPTHEIHDGHQLIVGFAIDGGEPETVRFEQGNDEHNRAWKRNVLRGTMTGRTRIRLPEGASTLTVYGLDPSVVLDQVIISTEGAAPSYLGPRPTGVR